MTKMAFGNFTDALQSVADFSHYKSQFLHNQWCALVAVLYINGVLTKDNVDFMMTFIEEQVRNNEDMDQATKDAGLAVVRDSLNAILLVVDDEHSSET